MNTEQVEAHLRSRVGVTEGTSVEFGRRGHAAFVRLQSAAGPRRRVVVASPGEGWFSVQVAGGFSLDHFNEGLSDDEVRGVLDDYLAVAHAYLRSGASRTSVGRLRFPALVVSTPQGERTLRRSLVADVKGLLRLWGRE